MDKETKKNLILRHERILSRIYRFVGKNHFRISKGNTLIIGNAFMKQCRIIINGTGNIVSIEPGLTRLHNSSITISGNNNFVQIGSCSNLDSFHAYIEDNDGSIIVKKHVTVCGHTELSAIEGTSITIGDECLFSSDIAFRTGDSHSIINRETGKRINPSKDIVIGNHVWIGNGVKILKGVTVGEHSIVGMGSILSSGDYPDHCVIGGIGRGRVLKCGIDWDSKRLGLD